MGIIGAFLVMITKKLYLGFVFFYASSSREPADRLAWELPRQKRNGCPRSQWLLAIIRDYKCKYSEILISTNIAAAARCQFETGTHRSRQKRPVFVVVIYERIEKKKIRAQIMFCTACFHQVPTFISPCEIDLINTTDLIFFGNQNWRRQTAEAKSGNPEKEVDRAAEAAVAL